MRARVLLLLTLLAIGGGAVATAATGASSPPVAHAASTCADYPNQAAAQAAADTRDADGDGVYCESLPCPCSSGGDQGTEPSEPAPAPTPKPAPSCVLTSKTAPISFSKTKYPNIRRHYLDAIAEGWPKILTLNRPGADARRDRLLQDVETRDGFDRDEYPPALARGRGFHVRGVHPLGWMASVDYVPSSENRSHGSVMGAKLKRFCNGQRFKYVFY
jgi:hypothetical protein